jgi:transmembrane sensor
MNTPLRNDSQALDPEIVEQAMLWMVRLQSGVSHDDERIACHYWRQQSAEHERAWQRLNGIGQGLRDSTHALDTRDARHLLMARTQLSRRGVLKGMAGVAVILATGQGIRQRSLLPSVFSDYATSTGQRRSWDLDGGLGLQLDTRTALDSDMLADGRLLTLNNGRVLMELSASAFVRVATREAIVLPAGGSRLMISHGLPNDSGTRVQLLHGMALVEQAQGQRFELTGGWQQAFSLDKAGPVLPLPPTASAWAQGQLIAERMPLGQLLAELDRYRPGFLRCDPSIAGLQVSGAFSIDQPEASLELLTKVLPVRVHKVFGYWANVLPA